MIMPPGERLPVSYFDGTIPDAGPDQGYYYSLDKGDAKQFRLGYFVDEVDLFNPIAICIGIHNTPSAQLKYQLRFTITADMVDSRADDQFHT